jgi:hypothetical protein
MMPCERKSVEPMAAVTAPERTGAQHQSLFHFLGECNWSDAEQRRAMRREQSAPHCDALKRFLERQLGRVSAKAPIAQASVIRSSTGKA